MLLQSTVHSPVCMRDACEMRRSYLKTRDARHRETCTSRDMHRGSKVGLRRALHALRSGRETTECSHQVPQGVFTPGPPGSTRNQGECIGVQ